MIHPVIAGADRSVRRRMSALSVFAVTALLVGGAAATAPAAEARGSSHIYVDSHVLGSAANFKLLAGAAITAPGTTIYGNMAAGAAITMPGTKVRGGGVTAGAALTTDGGTSIDGGGNTRDMEIALNDLAVGYETLRAVPAKTSLVGDLAGRTLTPGVYHLDEAITINGVLTLDGEHDSASQFIFQGDAAMVTAAMSRIILINSADSNKVFWVLDGAATFGANSVVRGQIVSNAAITFGANCELHGAALSVGAAITMPHGIAI
jgi:hypothetical protein